MLRLSQMIQATPKKVKEKAKNVRVRVLRCTLETDEHDIPYKKVLISATDSVSGSGRKHYAIFRFYSTTPSLKTVTPNNYTWLHCNCEFFLYYAEVAIALRGSSDVFNSNGAMPVIRNPRRSPMLCKHLLAAVKVAMAEKPIIPKTKTGDDKMFDAYNRRIPNLSQIKKSRKKRTKRK